MSDTTDARVVVLSTGVGVTLTDWLFAMRMRARGAFYAPDGNFQFVGDLYAFEDDEFEELDRRQHVLVAIAQADARSSIV